MTPPSIHLKTLPADESEGVPTEGRKRSHDAVAFGAHPTLHSAATAIYDGALQHTGGRRLDATSHFGSREVYVALYESPPYDLKIAAVGVPRLSINLVDAAVVGCIASDRSREYPGRRYSLFFTPAHSDAHWIKSKYSRHLNIYLRDGVLDEFADDHGAMLCRDRPLLDVHITHIKPWIDALELSIRQGGPFADNASLGLAHLIVAELARSSSRCTPTLRPSVLADVQDYVRAHLGERIYVSDLAALAGMPPGRFGLSFRASVGCTPHRYILQERVEAARRLLTQRRYSLAEVAVECGFSSQQHMATVMRKFVGMTPSAIRYRSGSNTPE